MKSRDPAIAEGIRRGDPGAFDAFFDLYSGPILAYLRGMVGDASLADDLLQETLLRVYRNIDRYEERGAFRAWVFRIATNLAVGEIRRRRYGSTDALDERALEIPERDDLDPHQRLEDEERRRLVEAGLATLAEEHRAVILLRVREGMGVAEIARTLCVPEGTIKSRLHYAVHKLREFARKRESGCKGARE